MEKSSLFYTNQRINLSQKEITQVATEMNTACSQSGIKDKLTCYMNEFEDTSFKYGLLTTQLILFSLQDQDDLAKSCHVLGHGIGEGSYNKSPGQFWVLLKIADTNACGSGIMHGLLEAYIRGHPEIKLDGNLANSICEWNGDAYKQRTCTHLMGHLFLLNTDGNLEQALPLCESITENLKINCYDGLFMEDHQKFFLTLHGILPRPVYNEAYIHKLETECFSLEGVRATSCWTEMAEIYDHVYGYNPQIVFKECSKAPTAEDRARCYSKGVIALGIQRSFDSPQKLLSICSFYLDNPTKYNTCTQTLIATNIYNTPKMTPRMVMLCSSVASPYTDKCFTTLSRDLATIIANPLRKDYCTMLPQKYGAMCAE